MCKLDWVQEREHFLILALCHSLSLSASVKQCLKTVKSIFFLSFVEITKEMSFLL